MTLKRPDRKPSHSLGAQAEALFYKFSSASNLSSWLKTPTTPRLVGSSGIGIRRSYQLVSQPGFEKHSATVEGQTASDLYNERTLVLTRAFVKRGCEYPPLDFGAEIRAYYFDGLPTTGPGALRGIVEQAQLMLQESEVFHQDQGEATEEEKRPASKVLSEMKVLTEGACLSLKRTLKGLEMLLPR